MIKQPRILIVDDDQYVRQTLRMQLYKEGYTLIFRENGEQLLNDICKIKPDVILLDVMMPGLDGFEICKLLKNNQKYTHIPIIINTALNGKDDLVKGLEAGADEFVTKPVKGIELRARVNSMIKVKAYNDYMRIYQRKLKIKVRQKTKQLRMAYKLIAEASYETIYRLCRAAEYKDEDTGSHIKRMSEYSARLAKELGQKEEEVNAIKYASSMHDIGKIGIPDGILLKEGKLTNKEWSIMKKHTVIGAQILEKSNCDYLKLAETIALTHHERWDGTGYPRGLSGNNIPLAGRITAVTDVFDALTSKRPYKPPLSINESFTIIKNGSGVQFDPQIVECFLDIQDAIIDIKEKNSELNKISLFNRNKVKL